MRNLSTLLCFPLPLPLSLPYLGSLLPPLRALPFIFRVPSSHAIRAKNIKMSTTPAPFDPSRLDAVNELLADSTPQEILAWAIDNLPGLYQTTAFGLTGLAAVDMVSKLSKKRAVSHFVPLIFIDTLYHFAQTLKLTAKITKRYKVEISVYKPPGAETVDEFEAKYGQELWKSDEDTYDYLVKVRFSAEKT